MSKDNPRQYRSGTVFQRKDRMWIGRFEAGVDRDGNRLFEAQEAAITKFADSLDEIVMKQSVEDDAA